jgi:hypothetical protein
MTEKTGKNEERREKNVRSGHRNFKGNYKNDIREAK